MFSTTVKNMRAFLDLIFKFWDSSMTWFFFQKIIMVQFQFHLDLIKKDWLPHCIWFLRPPSWNHTWTGCTENLLSAVFPWHHSWKSDCPFDLRKKNKKLINREERFVTFTAFWNFLSGFSLLHSIEFLSLVCINCVLLTM